MIISNGTAKEIKIAYIGGGSRGWAWSLMGDLASEKSLSGTVYLYDIDKQSSKDNEIIGNNIVKDNPGCAVWEYRHAETIGAALTGANFVVISILPGTFAEMGSDIGVPEKYGIYQPVGDSTGVGGTIRALRSVPMFKEIALAVKEFCPQAYVINYTNPMSMCIKALYEVFPQIKAVGCCHEVFGTQALLARALKKYKGIETVHLDINVEVSGINHFTWITKAMYKDIDVYPLYERFVDEYGERGFTDNEDDNWMNSLFTSANLIKFDLFKRFGAIAAAGDRHLVEFCPGKWYLKDPEHIKKYKFSLTGVDWRLSDYERRLEKAKKLRDGDIKFAVKPTGEVGVQMIKALIGLGNMKTNVNIPNIGQMPQAPLGAVVETNALLSDVGIEPIVSRTPLSEGAIGLINKVIGIQNMVVKASLTHDPKLAFNAFCMDQLNYCDLHDSRRMFDEMIENTKKYLPQTFLQNMSNGKYTI